MYYPKTTKENESCGIIVDRDMVWKLGKLQSVYNELRFDVGTVLVRTNLLFFSY